jgi:hypothetical protein
MGILFWRKNIETSDAPTAPVKYAIPTNVRLGPIKAKKRKINLFAGANS